MGSPPMVSPKYKVSRVLLAVVCASACALGVVAVPVAPAHAADTITAADQPYFSYYHLDQARAKGYTGAGVTIAMIDGPVDTSRPELAGATVLDKSPCQIKPDDDSRRHGTEIASILVARDYGVAPQATLYSYQTVSGGSEPDPACQNVSVYTHASLINHAINDGADIVSISITSLERQASLKWAIARAAASGTIIVTGIGNTGSANDAGSLSFWSGVVGVSAVDINGARADYSSWGSSVTTAAVGGPIKAYDYGTAQIIQTVGTSISTPIVAGFLAMARQKWPDATSNQLLQLLIHTTVNPDGGWNPSRIREAAPARPPRRSRSTSTASSRRRKSSSTTHTPTVAWTNPSSEQPRTRTRHTSVRARATTRSRRNLRDAVRGRGPLCGVPASRVGCGRRSRVDWRGWGGAHPRAREARALLRPRR